MNAFERVWKWLSCSLAPVLPSPEQPWLSSPSPQPEQLDPGEPLEGNLLSVRKPAVGRTHSLPNDSYMYLPPFGQAAPAQLLAQTQGPQHILGTHRAQSGNVGYCHFLSNRYHRREMWGLDYKLNAGWLPDHSLCLVVCRLQWLGAFTTGGVLTAADRSDRPLQTHQPPQPLRLREHTTTATPKTHTHTQPYAPQTGD